MSVTTCPPPASPPRRELDLYHVCVFQVETLITLDHMGNGLLFHVSPKKMSCGPPGQTDVWKPGIILEIYFSLSFTIKYIPCVLLES